MSSKYCYRCGRRLKEDEELCEKCDRRQAYLYIVLSFVIPFMGVVLARHERSKKRKCLYTLAFLVHCIGLAILIYLFVVFPAFSIDKFTYFGKKPLCNLNETRAPHFGDFVFFLCYRCSFLILGGTVSFLFGILRRPPVRFFPLLFSILFIIPCLADGLLQTFTIYVSTNYIRSLTGFLAGIGIGYILYSPLKYLSWL